MSYVYGRRYNNFRRSDNSNRKNIIGATFNPYQPKTANMGDQHSYYSTINNLRRNSSKKKIEYNRPSFNYGNLLSGTKYKSVSKNGNEHPLFSNSYNIINNFNKNKDSKTNSTFYNKHFSSNKKDDSIKSILNYENKKEKEHNFIFLIQKIENFIIMIINKMKII